MDGKFCASFFCSTDIENNQIASFYTGAMADAGQLSFRAVRDCRLAIIAPNDPGAMVQYAEPWSKSARPARHRARWPPRHGVTEILFVSLCRCDFYVPGRCQAPVFSASFSSLLFVVLECVERTHRGHVHPSDLTRVRSEPWVRDPGLDFYPGACVRARPPEAVHPRSGHECCHTYSVAVA
jgi:hypothetical protein